MAQFSADCLASPHLIASPGIPIGLETLRKPYLSH